MRNSATSSSSSSNRPFRRPFLQLLALAAAVIPIHANPLFLGHANQLSFESLFGRGAGECANPCGWNGQVCCGSDQACYTDSNNQAQCSSTTAAPAATGEGYWKTWVTSWVETETETVLITKYSTGSSWCATTTVYVGGGGAATSSAVWAPAPAPATPTATSAPIQCNTDKGETSCGNICCASNQYCDTWGQCGMVAGAGTTSLASSKNTAGISPAILPTSSTLVTVTATSSPTTTVPFSAPVATGANVTLTSAESHNSGLSGGAIAGIVIGVLVGLFLLILLCLFCCARGIWNLIFGGRRKRTERTEIIEERHHRRYGGAGAASYAGGRADDRRWYGSQAPSRRDEKKKGKFDNLLGIGAGLAGLAAVLGLKRRHDRRHDEKSDYSSNYTDASYSYYTSESSASSDDRRTRATRDTRRSSRHR